MLMPSLIGKNTDRVNGQVTAVVNPLGRSFYRPMLSNVVERIEARLSALGMKAAEASRKAGLSVDAIRNMQRAARDAGTSRHGVSTRTIAALAPVLKTTTGWLLEGIGDEEVEDRHRTVPVIGYVGAGAAAHFYAESQGPFDEVPAPEGSTEATVAVEIRGESLGSFFDQWLVYYDEVRNPPTSDLIGRLCVVGLADGRVLVKKLQRGQLRGHYTLLSQFEPPIYDALVEWAALVKTMSPK